MSRIEAGFAEIPNPFNRRKYTVPLERKDVAGFVFWSKNFRPFMKNLSRLEKLGYRNFCFNFTITGLPREFEPAIPPIEKTTADLKELSSRYGEQAVFWRFDPIILSDITDKSYYINRFRELADIITPHVERCIFSFAYFYKKVKLRLRKLETEKGIRFVDTSVERKRDLAERLAELASDYKLSFEACCCEYLEGTPEVVSSRCVDGALMEKLCGGKFHFPPRPSRKGCGCAESSDIGEYGTCKGGCIYCYAR